MSLHMTSTSDAKRRMLLQRSFCLVCGVLVAVAIMAVAGMALDRIKTAKEPVYRPLFVGWNTEIIRGCGGMGGCVGMNPIVRDPTPPDMQMRPLGLAFPEAGWARPFPSGDSVTEIPKVEFTDTGGFGPREALYGSEDKLE